MSAPMMGFESGRGVEKVESPRGFDETLERFEKLLATLGLTTFAKIDFTEDAKRAGLTMPRTRLLIFGNPKGGTPVMVAAPSSALDLPLKVLFSEAANGKVWLTYNTPEYLAGRHEIPAELVKNIKGVRALVHDAVENIDEHS